MEPFRTQRIRRSTTPWWKKLFPTRSDSTDPNPNNNITPPPEPIEPLVTPPDQPTPAPRRTLPRRLISYVVSTLGIILVVAIFIQGIRFVSRFGFNFNLGNLISSFGKELKTNANGHVNVLVLGVGGGTHDGAYLTDSMMLVSVDPSTQRAAMLSIPRDLYVEIAEDYYEKINVAYSYNRSVLGSDEAAFAVLKNIVKKITGEDIQYVVRIDFQGFIELVDAVGGIDLDVPKRLVDEEYPVEDSMGNFLRNETLVVEAGPQTMDGETALRYARSRHSSSDFDRSLRQQQVLMALKEKAASAGILMDPSSIKKMYYALSTNIYTDATLDEIITGAGMALNIDRKNMISVGLNDACAPGGLCHPGGLLYATSVFTNGGQKKSILLPNGASISNLSYYKDIQLFTNLLFYEPEIWKNNARIAILNGTRRTGLGNKLYNRLTAFGFNINHVGNPPNRAKYPNTVIHYYPDGDGKFSFNQTLSLIDYFLLAPKEVGSPGETTDEDISIIIGEDYVEPLSLLH